MGELPGAATVCVKVDGVFADGRAVSLFGFDVAEKRFVVSWQLMNRPGESDTLFAGRISGNRESGKPRKGCMMAEDKKKKPVGKIIIAVLVVFVAVALFGGSGESKDYSADSAGSAMGGQAGSAASGEGESGATKYAITDEVFDTSDPYWARIKGTLTNNSGRDLSYVQVEYVLYDSDGAQIGNAFANTTNLKADGVWKFEASVLEDADSVARFELADVSAY